MIIVFLGPPGSGKGTQARQLSEKLKLPHIGTGNILRREVQAASTLGLKVKDVMNSGNLVPDADILELMTNRINESDCKSGFILDGFPRTTKQAKSLDEILEKSNRQIKRVFNIKVSDAILIERLSGRRTCKQCGTNYHIINAPAKKNKDQCDKCGSELYQRADDKVATIKQRLKVYEEQTASLIYFYKQQDKLIDIRGESSIDRVFKEIEGNVSRQ
ncbi:MAG: adenylate kinase [Planctomycetes bacterium]|nr:adenylate kinase [Planctomycetota bacterium]